MWPLAGVQVCGSCTDAVSSLAVFIQIVCHLLLGYSHYLLRATDEMFDQAFYDGSLPGRREMAVDAHPETLLV